MTHEQKLESAEFRTREEIETEMRHLLTHGARGPNAAMQVVHRIFDEVRAFGASEERGAGRAEQRRKDAEGAEPVKWQRDNPGIGWIDTPVEDLPFYRERGFAIRPLYTRPANVAALEARVKELEGALAQSAKRAFNHGYLIACCNISHLHDEPSIARDVLAECGLSAVDISAIELSDYDAKALAEIRVSRGDQDPIRSGEQL